MAGSATAFGGPGGIAAVLFDMDGTLLDSERLWDTALAALATSHGGVLSEAGRLGMIGRNAADSMRVFYADLGITEPDPVADNRFVADQMTRLFATELRWRPGAAELVASLRQAGVPLALVTSTARELVAVALASTLGTDTFQVVVCGNDVSRPKPHPECYRSAASQLGVPIGRCVAIEDSPTGIASAYAAGAVVVGVPGEIPLTGLAGAHLVASLTELDLPGLHRLARGGESRHLAAK